MTLGRFFFLSPARENSFFLAADSPPPKSFSLEKGILGLRYLILLSGVTTFIFSSFEWYGEGSLRMILSFPAELSL